MRIPELHGTTMPFCFEHLWEFLKDLMVGRQYANGNLLPLSAMEILAWCDINKIQLAPWEARLLRQMDVAFLEGLKT